MLTLSAVYVDAKCSNITFTMKENQKHRDKYTLGAEGKRQQYLLHLCLYEAGGDVCSSSEPDHRLS